MDRCNILGVNVNVTSMNETLEFIKSNIVTSKGKYICIANVHTTITAYDNEDYKQIQNEAFLTLPDGKPLSILSKIKGFKESQRITGPDLMEQIFKLSESEDYSHFFYGNSNEVLNELKANLLKKHPKLKIVGMYSPPYRELTEEEDANILKLINASEADFLWVGLGAPKQEIWMFKHRSKIQSLMIGVGAAFEYHADKIKRAPKWMQDCSLEWLYRLWQDPKRLFKRYLYTNSKFIVISTLQILKIIS